jgi:hypothetical protein
MPEAVFAINQGEAINYTCLWRKALSGKVVQIVWQAISWLLYSNIAHHFMKTSGLPAPA